MPQFDPAWKPAPARLVLPREEVHVWAVDLDVPAGSLRSLGRLLSDDEHARAGSIRAGRLRDRFLVGRGALRSILAGYAGRDAAGLGFRYNRWGKPGLEAAGDLEFNLSHSGRLAVCAVTRGRPVGVDVERVRRRSGYERIAERFFSAGDREALRAMPASAVPEAFCRMWTRTEARQKASGESVFGARPGRFEGWGVSDLTPAEGYVGAVIACGNDWTPERFCWMPPEPGDSTRSGS